MGADTGPPPPGPLVVEKTGMLSGFTGANVVQTGVAHLPPNVEITVALAPRSVVGDDQYRGDGEDEYARARFFQREEVFSINAIAERVCSHNRH